MHFFSLSFCIKSYFFPITLDQSFFLFATPSLDLVFGSQGFHSARKVQKATSWYDKNRELTFVDIVIAVRRSLWTVNYFSKCENNGVTWSSICTHLVKQLFSYFPKIFQIGLDSYTPGSNADDSSYKTWRYSSRHPVVPHIVFDKSTTARVLA